MDLSPADRALIDEAKRTADALHLDGVHEVAAALRTRSGAEFAGINIKARMGFADACGEVAALCAMVGAGRRELISDFDPATRVIVGTLARPYAVTVAELLPLKAW